MSGLSAAEAGLQLLFNADNLTAEKISDIAKKIGRIGTEIQVEVKKIKDFKIDVHWKSRVINVPKAVEHIRNLIDELTTGLRAKVAGLVAPFKAFSSAVHAAEAEVVDPQLSKIATSVSKVEDFVTSLNILVGSIDTALDDAIQLQSLFERVLKDIQSLDEIFLPQSSTRKKVTQTYYKRSA